MEQNLATVGDELRLFGAEGLREFEVDPDRLVPLKRDFYAGDTLEVARALTSTFPRRALATSSVSPA